MADLTAADLYERLAGPAPPPHLLRMTTTSADPLDTLVHLSRLLGGDLRLVQPGGGNTSIKLGDALLVKGSGTDLRTIGRDGFTRLSLTRLARLAEAETMSDADMMRFMAGCMLADGPAPSVETPLHSLLPYRVIAHTHDVATMSLTNVPDGTAERMVALGAHVDRLGDCERAVLGDLDGGIEAVDDFARVSRHAASSCAHDAAIAATSSPARIFAIVAFDPISGAPSSSLNCAPYIFDSVAATCAPTRIGRSRSRSVTMAKTPWHAWPPSLAPGAGVNVTG